MPDPRAAPPERDVPCPCGSGRPYKACCGREAPAAPDRDVTGYPGWERLAEAERIRLRGLLRDAVQEQRAARLAAARALYLEVLADAPGTFDAVHMLGIIAFQFGQLDEARRYLRRALDLTDWQDAEMRDNLEVIYAAADEGNDGTPACDDEPCALPAATLPPWPATSGPPNGPDKAPSAEHSGWQSGFFDIPAAEGEYWFNPGAIMLGEDLHLALERVDPLSRRPEIVFIKLDAGLRPVAAVKLGHVPKLAGERLADGRCIPIPGRDDRFLVAASNFVDSAKQHQAVFEVDRAFNVRREIRIDFGGNAASISAQRASEKNWQFFFVGDRLHFVYWIRPNHVVCEVEGDKVVDTWTTRTFPRWLYGCASGGTPPVRIGDLYWSFFHSFRSLDLRRRRYFMGVYAFDATPPYAVRGISAAPILIGSTDHPLALWRHLVVFPAGALFDESAQEWLLTLGVNDCLSAWMKIPHRELLDTVDWSGALRLDPDPRSPRKSRERLRDSP